MGAPTDESWVVTWETGANGQLVSIHPAWRKVTGQSPETAIDDGWLAALHDEDRSSFAHALRQAVKHRRPFRSFCRLRRDDGSYRRAFAVGAPRFGDADAFLGHVGTIASFTESDVTPDCPNETGRRPPIFDNPSRDRGQLETARRGEDLNARALQALPAHIAVLDHDGRIVCTNDAWEQFAAENDAADAPKVAAGANYLDICRRAATDDEFASRALNGLESVMRGEQPRFTMEYPCHSPRMQRWFYMTVAPLSPPGRGAVVAHMDVTERKQTEAALRASEQALLVAQRCAKAGVWDVDFVRNRVTWSEPYYELYGLPRSVRPSQENWIASIHPDDRARVEAEFAEAMRVGGSQSIEFRILCDGEERWLQSEGRVVRDSANRAVRVAGITWDITTRKRAEDALRASEQRFRQVAESLPQLVWTCAPDGPCDYLSPQWVRYTGREEPQQLGFGWLEQIHPDDRQRVIDQWMAAAARGDHFNSEFRIRRHDGAYRWFRTLAVPLRNESGEVIKWFGSNTDIDDLKQAELASRESQRQLALALEAGQLGFWDWDIISGRVQFGGRWASMLGYQPDEIEPHIRAWEKLVHPEEKEAVAARLSEHLEGRADFYECEHRLRHKDGSWRWILDRGKVVERDADGRPLRALGTHADVTVRHEAESALRQSEERLRRILETDAVGVLFFDKEGYVVDANGVFLSTTGYSRSDLDARALHWRSLTPPEHIDISAAQLARLRSTGRIGPYEKEYFLKDGSKRWMLFAGSDLGDGTIVEYCVDISERKRAEAALRESDARLRAMADTAPVLIWETDTSGVTFVNRHYLDFFGVAYEAIAGMGWVEFVHPDDKAAYLKAYADAFATRSAYTHEGRLRRADGRYRWLRTSGQPIDECHFVGCSIDITERKDAEEVLRETDRRKDEFIATLAHELRNPLTPIHNAALILRKKYGPDAADAALFDMIQRQTAHLVRLVDELLEVSRISRGKIVLRKENVDMAIVLRDALETCRPLIESKGHKLTVNIPSDRLSVYGDPVRLVQIATNLINNAAKYTLPGGRIEIDVRRDGTQMVLRVRDNGVGIDPAIIPAIYELFAQTSNSARFSEGGLGIGLALVRKLVALHGGAVDAHSDGLGKGSEFTVRLPLEATAPATAPTELQT